VIVSSSNVTEAFRANTRPRTVTPVSTWMEVNARMFPVKLEVVPSATCEALLITFSQNAHDIVSVVAIPLAGLKPSPLHRRIEHRLDAREITALPCIETMARKREGLITHEGSPFVWSAVIEEPSGGRSPR
jgi:hypothetical protein